MFETIPENTAAKEALRDRLEKAGYETVAYSVLSKIAGGDVQHKKRYILDGALKLLIDKGIVFACVHGVGFRRLKDNEIPSVGHDAILRIRSTAKRTQKKLACADDAKLENQQKIARNASLSLLGAIGLMVKPQHVKRLEAVVTVNKEVIQPGRIHALFGSNGDNETQAPALPAA